MGYCSDLKISGAELYVCWGSTASVPRPPIVSPSRKFTGFVCFEQDVLTDLEVTPERLPVDEEWHGHQVSCAAAFTHNILEKLILDPDPDRISPKICECSFSEGLPLEKIREHRTFICNSLSNPV